MKHQRTAIALLVSTGTLMATQTALAQEGEAPLEEVVATGIRGSLANSLEQKRNSDNLVEVIIAEDVGKLPDQNLAEVLENLPGIQITRTAGIGTGVQIRGTNANRTEINGVSTVGSGSGRSGIDFEDISAAMISAVEVIKQPDAQTIEGSVGGTINLRTIRPLELSEPLGFLRAQGENSSLNPGSSVQPRLSAAFGNNWETDVGDFGVVLSGSWTRQSVRAFRPRADRDNFVAAGENASADFDFLPIQFFVQDYDAFEYETANFAGSLEWAPSDGLEFYFDAIVTDQESRQESSRVQTSGVSNLRFDAIISEFETVDFGTLVGENGAQDLGTIQAAVRGVIPAQTDSPWDPNLRLSGDTNSRLTESQIFRLGANWERGIFSGRIEGSTSNSDTNTPSFNTTLNFINPNVPFGDPNENGTPIEFDLTGGSLTFGIASGEANAPSTEELLDPANYRLRDVNQSQDIAENEEIAFRVDFTTDLGFRFLPSVDFGYRYNDTSSLRNQIRSNKGLRNMVDSPAGDLFASILAPGPDNFNDADGRALFFPDFLTIDPELVADDPEGALAVINDALAAHHAVTGSTAGGIDSPTSSTSAFFDITEKTNALYLQGNFQAGVVRGNVGVRYVDTDISSVGNRVVDDVVEPTTTEGSYDFWLPRINLVAEVAENVQVRAAWSKDIRRPNFDDLSTSFSFSTSPNPAVELGNPGLEPEEVESFDLGVEWYFAPGAVLSVGYFRKEREGLFSRQDEDPIEDENGFRDITDPCEDGGIFNPIADPNVFAPPGTPPGVCVPTSQTINGAGTTTLQGAELIFQYSLIGLEDRLGWASGFGVLLNYTYTDFSGNDEFLRAFSRPTTVFDALGATDVVTLEQPLIDQSENAYNVTLFYEKYGLQARVRYTWRDAYRSTDFGSTSSFPWGFPVVQEARGQLNAAVNYYVNDHIAFGVEAINITESDVVQSCVNSDALLCFQGLTDRRITFGGSYRF